MDQKRLKTLKVYGMVEPCCVFKIAYISNGAIVISLISFHFSDNNKEQDMGNSLVTFQSIIINTIFFEKNSKDFSLGLDLSGPPCIVG